VGRHAQDLAARKRLGLSATDDLAAALAGKEPYDPNRYKGAHGRAALRALRAKNAAAQEAAARAARKGATTSKHAPSSSASDRALAAAAEAAALAAASDPLEVVFEARLSKLAGLVLPACALTPAAADVPVWQFAVRPGKLAAAWAYLVSKLPADFAPTTLHGLCEAFKGVAARTPPGTLGRDVLLTIGPSDLQRVPPRASWGPGTDGSRHWRGHDLASGGSSSSSSSSAGGGPTSPPLSSVVHRLEPAFLARHALGPGGDASLLATLLACSGSLAGDGDRDPASNWAVALGILEGCLDEVGRQGQHKPTQDSKRTPAT
jgi:hypothetical protein